MDAEQNHTLKQRIQDIFDRAAPTYDHVGANFFSYFGQRLVNIAHLRAGTTVLDIATGRGAVLFPAAECVGPLGRVVGIDLAPAMIAATQSDVMARGITTVELKQMDAEQLTFPDASFDTILCGFALFALPHLEQALSEMQRVLRPGGQIAVSTWVNVWGPEGIWLEPLQMQFLPPFQPPARNKDGSQPMFDTPDGLSAVLARAGFTNITIIADTARFIYADEEAWWASLWSHGMRGWLEAVEQQQGSAALQRFKAAAFAELAARRTPEGLPQTSSVLFGVATKGLKTHEGV
jgi:ubiquinone/menaquinone biosynthesis C-methylase UbiE